MNRLHMKPHCGKGLLITFCGLDGCGKSSIIRLLIEKLRVQGDDLLVTKQPTDGMRNTDIFRTYMDSEDHSRYEYRTLSLMAAADRIQHSNQVIMPALASGKSVVSDRYFYSCLANLRARGYRNDRWIYEIAQDIPKPDLAFFLDIPVEFAVARVRMRPEEKDRYIDLDLQYELRAEYRRICEENDGILISSDRNLDETFAEVFEWVNLRKGGQKNESNRK